MGHRTCELLGIVSVGRGTKPKIGNLSLKLLYGLHNIDI